MKLVRTGFIGRATMLKSITTAGQQIHILNTFSCLNTKYSILNTFPVAICFYKIAYKVADQFARGFIFSSIM